MVAKSLSPVVWETNEMQKKMSDVNHPEGTSFAMNMSFRSYQSIHSSHIEDLFEAHLPQTLS